MKYDFTTVPDRKDGSSQKWNQMFAAKPDVGEDVVPLSTADMEFYNAPEISRGLARFAEHQVLGYTSGTDAYYDAVIGWQKKRHGFDVRREWIVESAGVVPAMGTAVNAWTKPGEGVLLLTPIYSLEPCWTCCRVRI